jgi:hypothetical protein
VQATLASHDQQWTAHVAWVIGASWQQRLRSEAAQALASWLGNHGVGEIVAHIHVGSRGGATSTKGSSEPGMANCCYARSTYPARATALAVVTGHVLRSYERRTSGAGRPHAVSPLRRPPN